MIVLKSKRKKSVWYIESGFSTHMQVIKFFLSLQEEKDGTITFGNDGSAKVMGKGTVKLEARMPWKNMFL